MGNFLSFSAGLALFIVALIAMKTFWPFNRIAESRRTLTLAIFLGFFSDAINTLWWQIGAVIDRNLYDWFPWNYHYVGLYLDVLFKGSAAYAGYLHLVALRESLPEDEQQNYRWFDMAVYPKQFRLRRKTNG